MGFLPTSQRIQLEWDGSLSPWSWSSLHLSDESLSLGEKELCTCSGMLISPVRLISLTGGIRDTEYDIPWKETSM